MNELLRVAMVMPDLRQKNPDTRYQHKKLLRACQSGEVELAVFPEGFDRASIQDVTAPVRQMADELGTPVLMGVAVEDQDGRYFETAVYWHPSHGRGETQQHVYVKHSTSQKVAFEWAGYMQQRNAMFQPIALKGHKIGVQVCHDMFFGLITQRLAREGADIFLDLSFGNVNYKKWVNVIKGRSLELARPFLCTMNYDSAQNGVSGTIAFVAGRWLEPTSASDGKSGGWFDVYDLSGSQETIDLPDEQSYATTKNLDISFALGTGKKADVQLAMDGDKLTVTGKAAMSPGNEWVGVKSAKGTIGVLPLPLGALRDGVAIYEADVPDNSFDHYVVAYHSPKTPANPDDELALAKLRAIEHRVCVVLMAGEQREVVKTNRFKNIQRFEEDTRRGVFAVDAKWMGGTRSALDGYRVRGIWQGVPSQYYDEYMALRT